MGPAPQTEFQLDPWLLTPGWVADYLAAVGDGLPVYAESGLAPPLALAARTLGQLMDKLSLPAGAIHSLQELEVLAPARTGQQVRGTACLERARRRGSMEFRTVAYRLSDGMGRGLLNGQSTVLIVAPQGPRADTEAGQEIAPTRSEAPGDLPPVGRTITQAQLNAYSQAAGDHNPLHWDAKFAAGAQFGGIIAHGMLTLGFVAEMLAGAFGRAWLESGELKARFKGAARPGDRVVTWGRINKEEPASQGRRVHCLVALRHAGTGAELVSGSASVLLPGGTQWRRPPRMREGL